MIIAGKTDIGKRRPQNQDSFKITPVGADAYLAVVCDGMGGAAAGDVASSTASDCFSSYICANYIGGDCTELISDAVCAANSLVYDLSMQDEKMKGMGTTLVAALMTPDKIYVANVGDSRLYGIKGDEIVQQTRDHTLVQMLVDRGELTLAEAKNSPNRHFITRSIGVEKAVTPDIFEISPNDFDSLVLCSDGLHGNVSPEKISSVVQTANFEEVEKSAAKLIDCANRAGGSDNITAVIVKLSNKQD